MKALIATHQRIFVILLFLMVSTLLIYYRVHAQSGSITDGAGSTRPAEPVGVGAVPGGPGYVSLNGYNFSPIETTNTAFLHDGSGLRSTGSAGGNFGAPLQIPNGSTITKMVVYYIDFDAGVGKDLRVDLNFYPLVGYTRTIMASVLSSGSPGTSYGETTTIINPKVDLASNSYTIVVNLPASLNLYLLGVRIDYAYQVSLPVAAK